MSFRWTYVFPDGDVLTSDSTIRFRERGEIEDSLAAHGYALDEVRDAPDRPGRELVFLARRPARSERRQALASRRPTASCLQNASEYTSVPVIHGSYAGSRIT